MAQDRDLRQLQKYFWLVMNPEKFKVLHNRAQKAYSQKPENKAAAKAYSQKPEIKAAKKAYHKAYNKTWSRSLGINHEKKLAWSRTPKAKLSNKICKAVRKELDSTRLSTVPDIK